MKSRILFFITGIFLLFISEIQSQDLILSHNKKIRTIEVGTFVQIELSRPNESPCINCLMNYVTGRLISMENDTLVLSVVESNQYITDQDENVGYVLKKYTAEEQRPRMHIPAIDILSIIKKGKNKVKAYNTIESIGNALGAAAIGFLALSAIESDHTDEDKIDALQIGCVYVLATSFVLSTTIRQPFYMTSTKSMYLKPNRQMPGTKSMYFKPGREIWHLE